MRLTQLYLPEDKPKELRLVRSIDLENPWDMVLGWRVLIRGPAVVLLPDKGPGYEFARSACVLVWDSAKAEDYDKLTNYTSSPLVRKVEMSAEELEQATAPAKAAK